MRIPDSCHINFVFSTIHLGKTKQIIFQRFSFIINLVSSTKYHISYRSHIFLLISLLKLFNFKIPINSIFTTISKHHLSDSLYQSIPVFNVKLFHLVTALGYTFYTEDLKLFKQAQVFNNFIHEVGSSPHTHFVLCRICTRKQVRTNLLCNYTVHYLVGWSFFFQQIPAYGHYFIILNADNPI